MENTEFKPKLLLALDNAIINKSEDLAIIKINDELREYLNYIHSYVNDPEETKAKTEIIAEFCMHAGSFGIFYPPKLVNKALTILKNLGYDIKEVICYYAEGMPAILTVDGKIGVVVRGRGMPNLKNLSVKPLDDYL